MADNVSGAGSNTAAGGTESGQSQESAEQEKIAQFTEVMGQFLMLTQASEILEDRAFDERKAEERKQATEAS